MNEKQISIFDDKSLITDVIKNIKILEEKVSSGNAELSKKEREFIINLSSMTNYNAPFIQREKMEGKEIKPFSKMILSCSKIFSAGKKAFNVFSESLSHKKSNDVNVDKFSTISTSIAPTISPIIAPTINTINRQKTITDKAAMRLENLSNYFDNKVKGGKSHFLSLFDEITLSYLTTVKATEDRVKVITNKINASKNKISSFLEIFEEPIIYISFRNKNSLKVDKFIYNVGLYLGKTTNKINDSLESFYNTYNNKNDLIKTKSIVNTELNKDDGLIKVMQNKEGINVSNVTRDLIQDANTLPLNTNIPGDNMKIEKKSFFKKIADAFKQENVSENAQELKGVKSSQVFARSASGALPEPNEIFSRYENATKETLGIEINFEGNYHFPKLKNDISGNPISVAQKLRIIKDQIIPEYLKQAKEATEMLFEINKSSKKDPELITFNKFSDLVGGPKAALNILEQARNSGEGVNSLSYLAIDGIDKILMNYQSNIQKIQENQYLLEVAAMHVKNVMNFGSVISDEVLSTNKTNPESSKIATLLNSHVLIKSTGSNKDVTVGQMITKTKLMDFSDTQKKPGNEGIVFRNVQFRVDEDNRISNFKSNLEAKIKQRNSFSRENKDAVEFMETRRNPSQGNPTDQGWEARMQGQRNAVAQIHERSRQLVDENIHLRMEGFQNSRDNVATKPPYMPPIPITPVPAQSSFGQLENAPKVSYDLGSAPQINNIQASPVINTPTTPNLQINQTMVNENKINVEPPRPKIPSRFQKS